MAIYGNNVAIVLWGPPLRMIIIRNEGIAKSFRQHFEAIWSLGKPVPDDVYQYHYTTKIQRILDEEKRAKDKKAAATAKAAKASAKTKKK